MHWTLAVVFREDDSRTRTQTAAANPSLARKSAPNLPRTLPLKMSLRRKRSACARQPERVLAAIAASIERQSSSLWCGSRPDLLPGWGAMPARARSGGTDRLTPPPAELRPPSGRRHRASTRHFRPAEPRTSRDLADSLRRPRQLIVSPCGLAVRNGRRCGGPGFRRCRPLTRVGAAGRERTSSETP